MEASHDSTGYDTTGRITHLVSYPGEIQKNLNNLVKYYTKLKSILTH